mgnify:CR=1 FL=1
MTGTVIGLMFAVLVRGISGCGTGEAENAGGTAASPDRGDYETAEAEARAVPEDIIDLRNTVCPVMGSPVQEGVHVDWEGYRVHFCCPGCDETFLANPEAYLDILAEDPAVAEKLGREPEGE